MRGLYVLCWAWHARVTIGLHLGQTNCSVYQMGGANCMTDTADPTSALCRLRVHRPPQTQRSALRKR